VHHVHRSFLLIPVLAVCAAGCSMNRPYNPMASSEPEGLAYAQRASAATLSDSLFKEDQALLSNEELKTILSAPVVPPDHAKLAVVRFGRMPYWWGWSEEFVRMNEQIDTNFLGTLRQSTRLRDVAYLPSLVAPPVMTVPYIRQASARLQADLVLIYRTATYNYERHKWFKAPRTRAYCTVEAVLLDTRTGVIPFSTIVNEQFATAESKRDYGFDETLARAEQQAIGRAWKRLAAETVAFLDKAERR
jgi:hypothetical protein